MSTEFRTTFVVGQLPASLVGERLLLPIEENATLPVSDLIAFADAMASARPALLLTDRDLSMPGCERLFGYADRDRGIAVISTFRLGDGDGLPQRVANEMAHELGHLQGYEHCSQSDCVMRPVTDAGELDRRPVILCDRCAKQRRWWRRAAMPAAAALFLAGAVVSGDYLLARITPIPATSPFSCLTHDPTGRPTPGTAGAADIAHIHFRGRMLFCLRDRNGAATVRERSLPLAQRVNELWQLETKPALVVSAVGSDAARIEAQGKLVVEVRPGDVVSGDAVSTARQWAQALTAALNEKTENAR